MPKRKFYDYKAKYSKQANTKHIMPVKIEKKYYEEINNIALKAHKLLKCRGVSRSDFKFYKKNFFIRVKYTARYDVTFACPGNSQI